MSAAMISSEVKAVQKEHPDWPFDRCWDFVESNRPELFSHSTVEGNRLRAKQRPGAELVQAQQQVKIERIARHLMQRNPAMTRGQALEATRFALPRVQAEIKELGRQAAAKAWDGPTQDFDEWFADVPKRQTSRVEADRVPEHPFQAEANRRGLLLIEGGFCNPIC